VVVSHAVTAAGLAERRAARLIHDLELGGLCFETPTVTVTPARFGLIGAGVLRHFTLGLTPSRGEVWLLPSGDRKPVTSPPIMNLGFFMIAGGDVFQVTRVLDGSDAARAGMRPGDHIPSINGIPAPHWTPKTLTDLAQGTEPVEILVHHNSVTRTLRVQPFMAVE
jgi:S1-C subfamily serine protease